MTVSVLGRADEGRDALMRAALGTPRVALEAWRQWTGSGADPRADPIARRWLPLVGWNLRATEAAATSGGLFHEVQREMWAANARLLAAAGPALAALSAADVPWMLLKGAALGRTVYEVSALRPIGDVDVLVPPARAAAARAALADLGWRPLRQVGERDVMLCHGVDLRSGPYGALDIHWYLLHECCWPGADAGLWARARAIGSGGDTTLVLGPADQLLHTCVHGLRWSPVHSGHWVADAARILSRADDVVEWDVLIEEARRRGVTLQVFEALSAVRRLAGSSVPDDVLRRLAATRVTWRDRVECHAKGRPVVSAGGLFVIWCGWRRAVRHGPPRDRPAWLRYLAAAVGLESPWRLPAWAGRHLLARLRSLVGPGRARRGSSIRERLARSMSS